MSEAAGVICTYDGILAASSDVSIPPKIKLAIKQVIRVS